jgi:hypothetical protein
MERSIVASLHHQVRVGDILYLYNRVFPYPPFTTYTWATPATVQVAVRRIETAQREGGSSTDLVRFIFTEPGVFEIALQSDSYSHVIVVCE